MNAKANETKVQQRPDGTCWGVFPAFVRDEMGMKGGSLLRWTPMGGGRWQVEVSGYEETAKREAVRG